MRSIKDVEFVGKYDFDAESAKSFASWGGQSFSVNIFQWGLKSSGKEMKPLKCTVRVKGNCSDVDKVLSFCENVVNDLDNGIWDGRKTVYVNW